MNEPRYGECPSCRATGVYRGTQELDGIGIVCSLCRGSGKVPSVELPLFKGRKTRSDVRTVFSEITDQRGIYVGHGINYNDFLKGQMPDQEGTTKVI